AAVRRAADVHGVASTLPAGSCASLDPPATRGGRSEPRIISSRLIYRCLNCAKESLNYPFPALRTGATTCVTIWRAHVGVGSSCDPGVLGMMDLARFAACIAGRFFVDRTILFVQTDK